MPAYGSSPPNRSLFDRQTEQPNTKSPITAPSTTTPKFGNSKKKLKNKQKKKKSQSVSQSPVHVMVLVQAPPSRAEWDPQFPTQVNVMPTRLRPRRPHRTFLHMRLTRLSTAGASSPLMFSLTPTQLLLLVPYLPLKPTSIYHKPKPTTTSLHLSLFHRPTSINDDG